MGMSNPERKPIIGVTGPNQGGKVLWWFTKLAIYIAGGKAERILPRHRVNLWNYHGFIISGGSDINPALYGELSVAKEANYDDERDLSESTIIRHALEHKTPILCICRGMQLMNIVCGGTLFQEAKEVLEDFLPSSSLVSKFIGRRDIEIDRQSQLFTILGEYEHYRVNSIHHQAINRLGTLLKVVAREKNNLIQAVEHLSADDHPYCIGVQWHPELMLHAESARLLFRSLVTAAHASLDNPATA